MYVCILVLFVYLYKYIYVYIRIHIDVCFYDTIDISPTKSSEILPMQARVHKRSSAETASCHPHCTW